MLHHSPEKVKYNAALPLFNLPDGNFANITVADHFIIILWHR